MHRGARKGGYAREDLLRESYCGDGSDKALDFALQGRDGGAARE